MKQETTEQEKSTFRRVAENVLYIVFVVVLALLFVRYVAVRSIVEGDSMYPFLKNGNNLIVQKVTYYFHDPERFDVIVFEVKNEPGVHYIKRVIGLPGETVQVTDGRVYINGEVLTDDVYCSEPTEQGFIAQNPVTLGEDEFFVMGDNRNHSKDSRASDVGPVKRSQIVGRALFRFWPLNAIQYVGR